MGPPCQPTAPMNGRTGMASPLWNGQSQLIGSQTNLSLQPSHMQQQQQSSTSWNSASIPHGFPATSYVHLTLISSLETTPCLSRSRRPVPSLNNPMGNGHSSNHHPSHTLMHGNGNLSMSQKKNASLSSQNNFFPYLPSTSNQNKYSNMQAPLISSMPNGLQRTPVMNNFIQTSNGQSPPPPPHILNGNDMEQNYLPMNVSKRSMNMRHILVCFFLF